MKLPATEKSRMLHILYTGEEKGYLELCDCAEGLLGGLPRRDSFIKSLQKSQKNILLLANGDIIDEPGRQAELKYEVALTALKEMGYAAVNVGDKDLLIDLEHLQYIVETSGIPLISANLLFRGKRLFSPYVLKVYRTSHKAITVAIIGILSSQFAPFIQAVNADLAVEKPLSSLRVHKKT